MCETKPICPRRAGKTIPKAFGLEAPTRHREQPCETKPISPTTGLGPETGTGRSAWAKGDPKRHLSRLGTQPILRDGATRRRPFAQNKANLAGDGGSVAGIRHAKQSQSRRSRVGRGLGDEGRWCETNPIPARPGRTGPRRRGGKCAKQSQLGDGRPASGGESCKTNPIWHRGQSCETNPIPARPGGTGPRRRGANLQNEPNSRRMVGTSNFTLYPSHSAEGRLCETKPIGRGVSSVKFQVLSRRSTWSELQTSHFKLPTRLMMPKYWKGREL